MSNGVNPNVEVSGGESAVTTGGAISFSEIEAATEDAKPAPKPKAEAKAEKAPKKEAKAEPKAKPKAKDFESAGDDDEDESAETEEETGDEAPKAAAAKDSEGSKPRVIKAKHGDKLVDLSSDMTLKVPVGGKKEEVPLEELVNSYTGKVNYDRKYTEFDKERKSFVQERDSLNDFANRLFEKSKDSDGSAIIDFLAEANGKDPVQLKSEIIRKQYAALEPLFQMSEDEREQAFKDMERDWRDAKHKRVEETEKEKLQSQQFQKSVSTAKENYKIPDAEFDDTYARVETYLKRKPELAEVIEGHRLLSFQSIVQEHLPHLAEHEKFDAIMSDMVDYSIRNPGYSKEDMTADLVAVYGEAKSDDKGRLKTLGRKLEKSDQVDQVRRPDPKSQREGDAMLFSDL